MSAGANLNKSIRSGTSLGGVSVLKVFHIFYKLLINKYYLAQLCSVSPQPGRSPEPSPRCAIARKNFTTARLKQTLTTLVCSHINKKVAMTLSTLSLQLL